MISKKNLIILGLSMALYCRDIPGNSAAILPVHTDTSITPKNAFINLFMDSTDITGYLAAHDFSKSEGLRLLNFYKTRNYQYAWFDSNGIAEQAANFLNLNRNKAFGIKSKIENTPLDTTVTRMLEDDHFIINNDSLILPTELGLTAKFFEFSQEVYAANNTLDLKELGWYIPKKKINIPVFLDSIVANKGRDLSKYEPMHPLYGQLMRQLEVYASFKSKGGWEPIVFERKSYKTGDSAKAVALIKKRLQIFGDLQPSDTGIVFTPVTREGVLQFQHRFGLKEDGIASSEFYKAINLPVDLYIKKIMINIERARWMPRPESYPYVVVNIPAYKMYVFDSGRLYFSMKAIVGSHAHNTVIFNGNLEYIIFSPYWNVPYSIVKNEMNKPASYFERKNMEIIGRYDDGLPKVRQKPGQGNALGLVKFIFPNSHSIYMHDTPTKNLFNENKRAFSHGCIRLSEPVKFAEYLLKSNDEWPPERIHSAMNGGVETTVQLNKRVPVTIGYFTAWVDSDGKLNIREDVYGHDKKMASRLFAEH